QRGKGWRYPAHLPCLDRDQYDIRPPERGRICGCDDRMNSKITQWAGDLQTLALQRAQRLTSRHETHLHPGPPHQPSQQTPPPPPIPAPRPLITPPPPGRGPSPRAKKINDWAGMSAPPGNPPPPLAL